MTHHRRGLRRILKDDDLVARIEADFESAGLVDRERAALRYAAKLTAKPSAMVPDDVERLRGAGFEDADILAICEVTAYYAYANRIADGLGVAVEHEDPVQAGPTQGGVEEQQEEL